MLRILTVFSIVLLPLTLLSGIFGMNVDSPGFATAGAFRGIVGAMVAIAVGLVSFFRYKRWLYSTMRFAAPVRPIFRTPGPLVRSQRVHCCKRP